jgi:hypothetical protein
MNRLLRGFAFVRIRDTAGRPFVLDDVLRADTDLI